MHWCRKWYIGHDRVFLQVQELAVFKNGAARFKGDGSRSSRQQEGDVQDLTGARVVTTMIVNGVPRTAVEVVEGVRKFRREQACCAVLCYALKGI